MGRDGILIGVIDQIAQRRNRPGRARRRAGGVRGTSARSLCRTYPSPPPEFRVAARIADQHKLGLRAGDALHLAIAADHGATIATLDKRLADAALALGVTALSP